jgi:hypothetical protein
MELEASLCDIRHCWGSVIEVKETVLELLDLDVLQVFPNRNQDLSVIDVTVSVVLRGEHARQENVTLKLCINQVKKSMVTTKISNDRTENAAVDLT